MSSEKQPYEETATAPGSSPTTATARTSIGSIETATDAERTRETARHANPQGFAHAENGIDVKASEADFAELQRELSGISQTSKKIARTKSRESHHKGVADIEKGTNATSDSASEDEIFDLESTLRGNQAAEIESGIRPKHIGVVWEGLTVTGRGGVTNFVKTFPDAFVSFFNVVETGMNIFGLGKKGKEVDILKDFRGVTKPGEMVLVLGRPGSGCTTFLKVIANQRFGYKSVEGEVLYGPFDSPTFAKQYRGEAVSLIFPKFYVRETASLERSSNLN